MIGSGKSSAKEKARYKERDKAKFKDAETFGAWDI
jgi:hypothetical protein